MNFIKKAKTQVKTIISKYEVSKDEEYDALIEKYKNSKKNTPKVVSHLKMLSDHAKGM